MFAYHYHHNENDYVVMFSKVKFKLPQGRQSRLQLHPLDGLSGMLESRAHGECAYTVLTACSVSGGKEREICSNRGLCNTVTGTCSCFDGKLFHSVALTMALIV
jgi:hypothetical protein